MTAPRLVLVPYGGSARSKQWTVEGPRDQEAPAHALDIACARISS
jgi:hypothetical protein